MTSRPNNVRRYYLNLSAEGSMGYIFNLILEPVGERRKKSLYFASGWVATGCGT